VTKRGGIFNLGTASFSTGKTRNAGHEFAVLFFLGGTMELALEIFGVIVCFAMLGECL
jgi:hypothetical protein